MKVSLRTAQIHDYDLIHYAVKKTLQVSDYSIDSCLTIVACDTYSKDFTVYGFVIVNDYNDIVFGYVKPAFRLNGIFTKLIKALPIKPDHYLNFVNHKSDKIMRKLGIRLKKRLNT